MKRMVLPSAERRVSLRGGTVFSPRREEFVTAMTKVFGYSVFLFLADFFFVLRRPRRLLGTLFHTELRFVRSV